MKSCFTLVVLLLLCTLLRAAGNPPASLSGTYRVGTSQPVYKKLKDVAAALNNAGNTVTGNIVFELDSDYDGTTGETFPIVFKKFNSSGNWTVTIRPGTGVSLRTTSGDPGANAYLIQLEDADRVRLDGRPAGTGSTVSWLIRNTRTASTGGTIHLKSDASHNIFTYLQLEAQSASPNAVLYLGEASAQGNDSNTVSYCTIRDRSDVTATMTAGIMSKSTQVFAAYNSGNIITRNNFINIYNNGGIGYGIYLAENTTQTEVTYNNFYQSRPIVNASSGTVVYAIYASQPNLGNMNIANNFIGGTEPGCGGSYFSVAGAVVRFGGIAFTNTQTGSGPANLISNNTIRNLEIISNTSPTGGQLLFTGIQVGLGYTDVVSNTIGSASGNNSIRLVVNSGNSAFTSHAISFTSDATGIIKGNTIGSITIDGTLSTYGPNTFNGINIAYTPYNTTTIDISGNLIGSTTTPGSIQGVSDSLPVTFRGIYANLGNWYGNPVYKKNIISNIVLNYNGASGSTPVITGIHDAGTPSITTLDSNTISHIYSACLRPAATTSLNFEGILTSGANTMTVKNNTVTELHLTNTGSIAATSSTNTSVVGLDIVSFNEADVYGNRITNLTSAHNLGTATSTLLAGIHVRSKAKVHNNTVSLDNGANTNNCQINCIRTYSTSGPVNLYYNSLYVGGNNGDAANTAISAPYGRTNSTQLQIKNNILYNARTGGSGAHYAYHNGYSSPATSWTAANIDYNLIVVPSLDKIGRWGSSTDYNQTQWKANAGDKLKSIFYTVTELPASTLFSDMDSLGISEDAWGYVKGKGTTVSGITTDYTGATRSTTAPTIGAYEFVPPVPPPFLSGTYLVGASHPFFRKLTDIAAALKASPVTGDVVFELDSDYNGTTGETFPIVFDQFTSTGGNWTVVVRPKAGVSDRITAGNPGDAQPLISLSRIDRITFDGRPGGEGTTTGWIIRNTNTSNDAGPVISFGSDASNNTLTWLQAEGEPASRGMISFGTGLSTGNDNNMISYCTIRNRTDVAGRMTARGIVSSGSTSNVSQYNSGLTITRNKFINIYKAGTYSYNIMLDVGTTASSVTYNSFYLTDAFVNTTPGSSDITCVYVRDGKASNMDVSHNFIGGSAPECGGAPFTIQNSGTSQSSLTGIVFFYNGINVTGTGNTVDSNLITNIDLSYSQLSLSGVRMFTGLAASSMEVFVTNNIIGDRYHHDAIRLTGNGTSSDAAFNTVGIWFMSPQGGGITGNQIGGFTFGGNLNSTSSGMFLGIKADVDADVPLNFNIHDNLIGNTAIADNIRSLTPTMPVNMWGISTYINDPATVSVENNVVAGFQSAYSGTGGYPQYSGIEASGNTVWQINHNLVTGLTAVSPTRMLGISFSSSATSTLTASHNEVHGLQITGTGPYPAATASYSSITGLNVYVYAGVSTIFNNRIYDLSAATTFTAATPAAFATLEGMDLSGKYNLYNNLVSLNNNNYTNNCLVTGMTTRGNAFAKYDDNIYHNTFFVGGSNGDVSNTALSYVIARTNTYAAPLIKNNLLVNSRTGGGAPGYIFHNDIYPPTNNWALGASNYNTIVTARVDKIGRWSGMDLDSTQWQTTAGDASSVFYTTSQVSPANLFVDAAAGNLAIKENARNYVAAKGTTGTGVLLDFAGTTRSTSAPSTGAYEYEYVPVDNNAPTDLALSASAIEENKPAGSTVGVFTATDPDAGNTFTYSLVSGDGSTDNAAFTITGDALTINASPDYETKSSYSIRVMVTDQGLLSYEKIFTITITDVSEQAPNNAPTDLALSATSIEENKPAGSTVGVFTATDPDAGNTFTYSLVSGDGSMDNAAFAITGDALTINASPDYETQNSYSIRVRVTDQGLLSYEKIFTITIADVSEQPANLYAPVITSHGGAASATLNVAENQTAVTRVTATDGDPGTTITYSLVGHDDDSYFTIDPATGDLVFNIAPDFERPSDPDENNMYMVTVQASDGELTAVQRFKVRVTNVNDNAPEFGSFDGDAAVTLKLNENTTTVGTVWAVDKEPGTTITYSILNGNEGALFSVNPVTGVLAFVTAPDYENPMDEYAGNVYIVTVQASDGELVSLQRFKIKIMDVNEGTGRMASGEGVAAQLQAGADVVAEKGIKVFPNPVTGKQFTLRVGGLAAGKYQLELYTMTGQLVYRRPLEHTGKPISYPVQLPASLTRGMYVLKLKGAGVTCNEKLMID